MKTRIIHSKDFVEDAANIIIESSQEAIKSRGMFRLSLCGGNTPRPVYSALSQSRQIPWDKVQLTFGDERCVPSDDPQSNFRMVKESLLDQAGIPESNLFRIRGELPPEDAALEYENRLQLEAAKLGENRYVHDLVLLGLGADGHTASLFPETAALNEAERNVMANFVPKLAKSRVTFTFPIINEARAVCFLVNDPAKEKVLNEILAGNQKYPASLVAPASGRLTWLLGF